MPKLVLATYVRTLILVLFSKNYSVFVMVFFFYLFVFIFIKHYTNTLLLLYHRKYVCLEKISLNLAADSLSSRNIYPTDRKLKTNFTNCKRHLVNSLAFCQDNHLFFFEFIKEHSYTHIIIYLYCISL